jgi:serine/threonine protein kinase
MALSLDEFTRSLSECGLMTAEEVRSFVGGLSADQRPTTAEQLAREMVTLGKLTKYQAQAIYQRKTSYLVLGNYVLLERIGRGGMGQVFKAKHKKMDRIVALKVLSPVAMKSPGAVKRFLREAKAAAKLAHPNIVTAHDADEDKGMNYLVTEYVDGETLAMIVRQHGAMSLGRAVDYIVQAARGLEYAHSNGVIHRDIKPSNLLLDKQGTVKILDMGIARVDEFVGKLAFGSAEEMTNSGVIVGTPDYMSPEQSNDIRVADARSDIYSLGCTLYFLLTGQPAFSGETVLQKIMAHREQPVPFLRDLRGDVPEALENVFQKMMAKRPQDRYRSMAELIAEIQKCIASRQQTTGSTSAGPYVFDETVRTGAARLPKPAEPNSAAQPVSAVGSLLDEWLVAEPAQVSEPLSSTMGTLSWRRKRRRFLKIAAAVSAVAVVGIVGYWLWSGRAHGTLVVEFMGSGGILEVSTLRGDLVMKCPVARGLLMFQTSPGRYRLKVTREGVDLFVREVSVPAGGEGSILIKTDAAASDRK